MGELTGRTAIVTGAAKGIGAGVAKTLAAAGASVAVNYRSGREDAERVVAEIVRAGGRAVAAQGDVARSEDVGRLFAETTERLGRPSILINNAGVFGFGPIESVTEDEYRRQFDTNVLGTLLTIREAARVFTDGGAIVNVSTISSVNPVPNSTIYSASKSAVDTITRALANELAARKIRVNAIAPGMTQTEGFAALGLSEASAKDMGVAMPMGRIGTPRDIAEVALFLVSDRSAWLTGERISASGGQR